MARTPVYQNPFDLNAIFQKGQMMLHKLYRRYLGRERASRAANRGSLLEALESRVLLAVTWTGGGSDNKWTTVANWDVHVPVAGEAVVFNKTATVRVDTDYDSTHKLASLTVNSGTSNSDVTLNFNHDG